jgi:hypothetical protein
MTFNITNALCIAAAIAVIGYVAWGVTRTDRQLRDSEINAAAARLVHEAEAAVETAELEPLIQLPDARKDQP